MTTSLPYIFIIALVGIVAYLVTSRALADHSVFGYPRLIAAVVCILGCMELLKLDRDIINAVLLPAAALLIAVCLMLAVIVFRRFCTNYSPGDRTSSVKPVSKKKKIPKKSKKPKKIRKERKKRIKATGGATPHVESLSRKGDALSPVQGASQTDFHNPW